jgi:hypothetical protein
VLELIFFFFFVNVLFGCAKQTYKKISIYWNRSGGNKNDFFFISRLSHFSGMWMVVALKLCNESFIYFSHFREIFLMPVILTRVIMVIFMPLQTNFYFISYDSRRLGLGMVIWYFFKLK